MNTKDDYGMRNIDKSALLFSFYEPFLFACCVLNTEFYHVRIIQRTCAGLCLILSFNRGDSCCAVNSPCNSMYSLTMNELYMKEKLPAQIKLLIDQDPSADHSLELLARQLHVSKTKLMQRFKAAYGTSIHQYVLKQRL